MMTLKAVTYNL